VGNLVTLSNVHSTEITVLTLPEKTRIIVTRLATFNLWNPESLFILYHEMGHALFDIEDLKDTNEDPFIQKEMPEIWADLFCLLFGLFGDVDLFGKIFFAHYGQSSIAVRSRDVMKREIVIVNYAVRYLIVRHLCKLILDENDTSEAEAQKILSDYIYYSDDLFALRNNKDIQRWILKSFITIKNKYGAFFNNGIKILSTILDNTEKKGRKIKTALGTFKNNAFYHKVREIFKSGGCLDYSDYKKDYCEMFFASSCLYVLLDLLFDEENIKPKEKMLINRDREGNIYFSKFPNPKLMIDQRSFIFSCDPQFRTNACKYRTVFYRSLNTLASYQKGENLKLAVKMWREGLFGNPDLSRRREND